MLPLKKRTVLIILGLLGILGATYFESHELEVHRMVVAAVGLLEVIVLIRVFSRFDAHATLRQWTSREKLGWEALFCALLTIPMVVIDRLVYFTVTQFGKEYHVHWTLIVPGIIIAMQLIRQLDVWAAENENKNNGEK